jgi:4-hydroxy-3-methylbut-2-enyl diphosphate reductase
MRVETDEQSGFCFGVVYAIEMAEDYLAEHDHLYCLGDIVHNDMEVKRLQAQGLRIIYHEDLPNLQNETVLIRAHGEAPETYKIAIENNITLVDASCPIVLKLQNRVRSAYEGQQTQIVIYGKPGHAEIAGLKGQTDQKATVITSMEDLDQLDLSIPIDLFSQTTKSTDKFYEIRDELERRGATVEAHDTICRQVSKREPQLRNFAASYDVIVFVAGKKSSNGKVLCEVCRAVNPSTYFVSTAEEVDFSWFAGAESVGVCGATSTPQWQIQQVRDTIEAGQVTAPPFEQATRLENML